jgi:hypothetical protein
MARPPLKEEFKELLPLYRGIVESEGCRRLAVAVGGFCAVVMAATYWIVGKFYLPNDTLDWTRVAEIIVVSFGDSVGYHPSGRLGGRRIFSRSQVEMTHNTDALTASHLPDSQYLLTNHRCARNRQLCGERRAVVLF